MKLLLKRDQRNAMLGSRPVHVLSIRVEITSEEERAMRKLKLDRQPLYERKTVRRGIPATFADMADAVSGSPDFTLWASDLKPGVRYESKNIQDVLDIEQAVTQTVKGLAEQVRSVMGFQGEQVLEL